MCKTKIMTYNCLTCQVDIPVIADIAQVNPITNSVLKYFWELSYISKNSENRISSLTAIENIAGNFLADCIKT